MATHLQLIKLKQRIAKMQRHYHVNQLRARRADTRAKIELGGLIIKGGLDQESKAVILGAIINAVEDLIRYPETRELYKLKGEMAFMGYKD
jgi:hypothetical protein